MESSAPAATEQQFDMNKDGIDSKLLHLTPKKRKEAGGEGLALTGRAKRSLATALELTKNAVEDPKFRYRLIPTQCLQCLLLLTTVVYSCLHVFPLFFSSSNAEQRMEK